MSRRAGLALFFVAAIAAAPSLGCTKDARVQSDSTSAASTSASGAVVDDKLLAYLSAARALHHEADLHEDANEPKDAITTLERVVALIPSQRTPEVDEVLADTYARLGDLRAQLDDFDVAEKDVDAGLLLAPETSYFRGHLFEVRGAIEQRRAKTLDAKGDTAGASKAKDAAMKAFEQAITIQKEVIDRGATNGGKP